MICKDKVIIKVRALSHSQARIGSIKRVNTVHSAVQMLLDLDFKMCINLHSSGSALSFREPNVSNSFMLRECTFIAGIYAVQILVDLDLHSHNIGSPNISKSFMLRECTFIAVVYILQHKSSWIWICILI